MKSGKMLVGFALFFLILAVAASVTIWGDVASPVKIGMLAFGFGAGISVGTFIARGKNTVA